MTGIRYTIIRHDNEAESWEAADSFFDRKLLGGVRAVMRGGEQWVKLVPEDGQPGDYHVSGWPSTKYHTRRFRDIVMFGASIFALLVGVVLYYVIGPSSIGISVGAGFVAFWSFRAMRTKHLFLQWIWLEGNPEPYRFRSSAACPNCHTIVGPSVDIGPLTASAIFNVTEADPIDRVYAPRRQDWLIVLVVGAMTGLLGFIVGAAIGGL